MYSLTELRHKHTLGSVFPTVGSSGPFSGGYSQAVSQSLSKQAQASTVGEH